MPRTPLEAARSRDYLLRLAHSEAGWFKAVGTAQLQLGRGHVVLDVGCGPGTDLGAYAAAVGPTGTVIGVDHDAGLIRHALHSTAHLANVSVELADAQRLPIGDRSVDRVHIDRMLQHVAAPAAVIEEAARVLRPDGQVVCVEPDWATLLIDHPDVTASRAYTDYTVAHTARNATIGRALPRLLRTAGLTVDSIIPATVVFTDAAEADEVLTIRAVTERAVAAGALSGEQGRSWFDQLDAEPFFASVTLFVVTATASYARS